MSRMNLASLMNSEDVDVRSYRRTDGSQQTSLDQALTEIASALQTVPAEDHGVVAEREAQQDSSEHPQTPEATVSQTVTTGPPLTGSLSEPQIEAQSGAPNSPIEVHNSGHERSQYPPTQVDPGTVQDAVTMASYPGNVALPSIQTLTGNIQGYLPTAQSTAAATAPAWQPAGCETMPMVQNIYANAAQAEHARLNRVKQDRWDPATVVDSSYPNSDRKKQVYVDLITAAMFETSSGVCQDNDKARLKYEAMAASRTGREHIFQGAWTFFTNILAHHDGGGACSHDVTSHRTMKGKFSEHVRIVCDALRQNKNLCQRAIAFDNNVRTLVDDVLMATKRSKRNQTTNRHRQDRINANKAIADKVKEGKNPFEDDDEEGEDDDDTDTETTVAARPEVFKRPAKRGRDSEADSPRVIKRVKAWNPASIRGSTSTQNRPTARGRPTLPQTPIQPLPTTSFVPANVQRIYEPAQAMRPSNVDPTDAGTTSRIRCRGDRSLRDSVPGTQVSTPWVNDDRLATQKDDEEPHEEEVGDNADLYEY